MIGLFKLTVWVLVTIAAGWSVVTIAVFNRLRLFFFEKLALSYCIGLASVSVEMVILSVLNIKFSVASILIGLLPLFGIALLLTLKASENIKRDQAVQGTGPAFSVMEKLLVFGTLSASIYTFFRALVKPMESYDAIAIYAIKSKIFYLAKAIPHDFFSSFSSFVGHIEYPLLVSLSETYFYIFYGGMNDLIVKIIFPLYYVAALAVLYFVLRRSLIRVQALLFTFLLASIPQFMEHATLGYTDLTLAFYCSASIFYIILWTRKMATGYLVLSALLSLCGIWTKTEGLMFIGVNICLVGTYMMTEGRKELRKGALYMAFLFAATLLYVYLRKTMGIKLHEDYASGSTAHYTGPLISIKRILQILYEYQRQFFGPKKWNLVWIVFIVLFILRIKKVFSKDMRFATLAVIFILCGYAAIYLALPVDIYWHLTKTASRFFVHFVPVIVLWIAYSFKDAELDI